MSFEEISTGPAKIQKIESYPISSKLTVSRVEEVSGQLKKMMKVRCRACSESFDTTFTIEDFQILPRDQIEAGTLHLCPSCGDLSLYMLKDYFEES